MLNTIFQATFNTDLKFSKIMLFVADRVSVAEFVKLARPTPDQFKEISEDLEPLDIFELNVLIDAVLENPHTHEQLADALSLRDVKPSALYTQAELLEAISDEDLEAEVFARGLID